MAAAEGPNFTCRMLPAIYPFFRVVFPNQVIRADDLSQAMVDIAIGGRGEHRSLVLENRDIRAMVKSHNVPIDIRMHPFENRSPNASLFWRLDLSVTYPRYLQWVAVLD